MILGIRISAAFLLLLFTFAVRASALVNISDDETIRSAGFGIYALSSDVASKDILVGSNVTVTVSRINANNANFAAGLYANGEGASIGAADNLKINARWNDARGVLANAGGVVEIGASANITMSGTHAHGAFAQGASSITIGSSAAITTSGIYANGAFAQDASSIEIGSFAGITTSGDFGYGAFAQGASSVTVGNSADITTSGIYAYGAFAQGASRMTIGSSADIATSGDTAHAVLADRRSVMNIGNSAKITTSGDNVYAVSSRYGSGINIGDSLTITTSGYNAYGAQAYSGSSVYIGDSAKITTSDNGSYGIFAGTDSSLFIGGAATITTSGRNSFGAYATWGSNIYIGDNATIRTTGDGAHAVFTARNSFTQLNSAEISATGAGAFAILSDNGSRVTGRGLFDITGDMFANDAGSPYAGIDLTMTDGSIFTGAAGLSGGNAEINLALDGAASTWHVNGDSTLTALTLNGSTVDFENSAPGTVITTDSLSGTDGRFIMKVDMADGVSDKLVVTGTSSGSYTITAVNDASAETDGTEKLILIETADDGASFALEHGIELGAWVYSLRQIPAGEGSAFQVYRVVPADAAPADAVNSFHSYSTGLSNAASAAVNVIAAGYLMGYEEMNTLAQRLGELRDTPHSSGFWGRVHGAGFNTDGMRLGMEFDLKYGGVHVGYDRKIETGLPGDLYAGVMFGYGKGDIDLAYAGGDGDVDSKTIGVYGAYKHDDGWYADAVFKYQWMKHGFDTFDSAGARVTANDVNTGGFGFSVEAGKRFELKNGWYVEPQAQLSYLKQSGGAFSISNGLSLNTDGWTSLQGRLGVRVGYENGARGFYAKVSWVREFDGGFDFTANGEPLADSFGDNWWVYGIGYVSKLNDRNSIYLDIERSSGGVFEQDWAIKAGWRITF